MSALDNIVVDTDVDAFTEIRQQLHVLQTKNRVLRARLLSLKLANQRNRRELDAHRSEASQRHQYIGELLVQRLSGESWIT